MCSLFVQTVSIFLMMIIAFHGSYCLKSRGSECPQMYKRTYDGYIPKGNDTAGIYTFFETVTDIEDCISKCCKNKTCNAAIVFNEKCYNVDCKSNEMCIPILHHNSKLRDNVTMVLVKPDNKNESWVNVLKFQDKKQKNWKETCPKLYEYTYRGYLPKGNISAGNFSYIEKISDFKNCILNCCDNDKCNVAIMHAHKCYNVACKSSKLCIPILYHNVTTRKSLKMVLVKPVDRTDQWKDILHWFNESQDEESSEEILPEISSSEDTTTNPTPSWQKSVTQKSDIQSPHFNAQVKVKVPNKKFKIQWRQIEGPTKLRFLQQNETSFNIKEIVSGDYLIKLSIKEERSVTNSHYDSIENTTENQQETTFVNEKDVKQYTTNKQSL